MAIFPPPVHAPGEHVILVVQRRDSLEMRRSALSGSRLPGAAISLTNNSQDSPRAQ